MALCGQPLGEVAIPALGARRRCRGTGSRRRGRRASPVASQIVGRWRSDCAALSVRATFRPRARYNRMTRLAVAPGRRDGRVQTDEHTRPDKAPRRPADADGALATPLVSVVIPCLNEAENIERCVHAALDALRAMRRRRRGASSPTTTPRTTPRGWPRAAGARVVREPPPRLRQRLPGRLRGRARALHRDGRRRPHLRLQRDPALRRGARGRAPRW